MYVTREQTKGMTLPCIMTYFKATGESFQILIDINSVDRIPQMIRDHRQLDKDIVRVCVDIALPIKGAIP